MPINVADSDDIDYTFSVNVFAPFAIVQTLASRRENASALESAVFVSSAISQRGAKGHVLYGASKAALDGLMRSLAVELAPKVRVNSVLPGFLRTPMNEALFASSDLAERTLRRCPLGAGAPKNVAEAVRFLLSEHAAWITGQTLTVDGGTSVDISI